MNRTGISLVFFASAGYDGLLGAAFLLASGLVFDRFGVTPPNHAGYVHFPAALLLVFAAMFAAIGVEPLRHRSLMPYGILLKLAYCGVVGYHWMTAGLPWMWKPFWVADFVFLLLFTWAWRSCRTSS
jgi:hypothetical protein